MEGHRPVVPLLAAIIGFIAVCGGIREADAASVRGGYLYTLSAFTGPVLIDSSRVVVDRERGEVYTLFQNTIRVYNDSGMEVYRFGDDLDVGQILDLAIDERGDVLLLTFKDSRGAIVRCDYRGRRIGAVALQGLRRDFSGFVANRMVYRKGDLFLASTMGLKAVVADRDGNVKREYDLFRLFELEEKDRGTVELGGFSVDADGNMLMTAPVLFQAFVLAPDGKVSAFGKPGGAPGRFNLVAGIVRDRRGNLLVVDRGKGTIQVFDPTFKFVAQFAGRGYKSGQLVFPDDVAIDGGDRVYVTQAGKRGISVFRLTYQ